ncbi:MAG: GNAT family N-acetyltransferase [Solirubrobacteraceae bacterium]|nr:GNAT family N-acetyltransferase [Solirubrobacteraceae bacterium]
MIPPVRLATLDDAPAVGRVLEAFDAEYGLPGPSADLFAERVRDLMAIGDTKVLLAGDAPDGLAVLRLRPSLYSRAPEAYLAELYVVPELRGRGLGGALLDAAIALARREGADHMDLGTSEDDVAARALYASRGFINREGGPDGPVMFVYEREL